MSESLKICFTGDIVFRQDPPDSWLDPGLAALLRAHDLCSCNLEAPIPAPGTASIGKRFSPNVHQGHLAGQALRQAGFNIINLANNHIYDYGREGLEATLAVFDDCLTAGAGLDFESAYRLRQINAAGCEVGFLSYCEAEFGALTSAFRPEGGYAWMGHPSVPGRIASSRKKVDILFVQVHGGPEFVPLPLPEHRELYRSFIDHGADAVIGHHPHVAQGWELYNGKPIFYSLGNFFPCPGRRQCSSEKNIHYAVSFSLGSRSVDKFEVIPIRNTREKSWIDDTGDAHSYLEELCARLRGKEYLAEIENQYRELWRRHYFYHHLHAVRMVNSSAAGRLAARFLIRLLRNRDTDFFDPLAMMHNLGIESHRWNVLGFMKTRQQDGSSRPTKKK
jgi:poly-gamma-glutamate synthesis protein (capsule biosynthesis protein)